MIPELGHFALIIAFCLALAGGPLALLGAASGRQSWIGFARPAAQGQCLFVIIAFAALTYAFVSNDFSVSYVANNSNTLSSTSMIRFLCPAIFHSLLSFFIPMTSP